MLRTALPDDTNPNSFSCFHNRVLIWVDGGVRSGIDVLKMLALGADAVLVGRPMAVIAVGGWSREDVRLLLNQYADPLRQGMIYTGSASLAEIQPSIQRIANR